jgi:[ribosomal protein S5]-alanine N-acetyltransferase
VFTRCLTERLLLRRPRETDLDDVHRIHADPTTNMYNPAGPDPDLAASRARLQGWLDHWKTYGFGYWAVEPRTEATVLGFCGVRHDQWLMRPILNLYYRFSPDTWGRGVAKEAARHAVELARQHFPDLPVLARTKPKNLPSQRTALAAGLLRRGDLDRHDGTGHAVILVTHWPSAAAG